MLASAALPVRSFLLFAALASGCHTLNHTNVDSRGIPSQIPRELDMASLPEYRVAPPDILLIELPENVRSPDQALRTGEVLHVQLGNPEPLAPLPPDLSVIEAQYRAELEARNKIINGEYRIQPDGSIDLGPNYGRVTLEGLTLTEAEAEIVKLLEERIDNPMVAVTLPDISGRQSISGEHLVRPDGSVSLGVYGSVPLAGLTLAEAKQAIEAHLQDKVKAPEISVDVVAYNSKVFYVIMDGGGYGERIVRLASTGNETVLDALAAVEGLSQVSSKKIWLARPAPAGAGCAQVMQVHYHDITVEGITDTNYQVLPGDRIYVKADHMIAFDNFVAKAISPFERMLGFTLLGTGTVKSIRFFHTNNGGGGNGGGSR